MIARRPTPPVPWSPEREAELADAVRVAHLFVERGYPTQSLTPRLILALKRRIETLEASNEALRHFREAR